MRVTNNITTGQFLRNNRRTLTSMLRSQNRITTQRKFNRVSEDSVNGSKAMTIRRQLRDLDIYEDNLSTSKELFAAAESNLYTIAHDIYINLEEKLVTAVNDTYDAFDLDVISVEVDQLAEQMVNTMNIDFAERQLYGGTSNGKTPFAIIEEAAVDANGDPVLDDAGNAVGDLGKGKVMVEQTTQAIQDGAIVDVASQVSGCSFYVALICGLITLFAVILFSVYGKKMMKLIPFILGILVGYIAATIFTVIGIATDNVALQVIDFTVFKNMQIFAVPDFTFLQIGEGAKNIDASYIATIAVAYAPVAFVVFAEHIADHKNLSFIIEQNLLKEPGLHRTLLGDGVGSMVGAFFGGCPNTTYGESVGCVAITRNASVITITTAAIMCILFSFFSPFVTFLATIPNCVMGGVCIALYGFIAVSGLKMIQKVDLNQSKNLFVVSVILITGIGGLSVSFGKVTLTSIACALILGIVTNVLVSKAKNDN